MKAWDSQGCEDCRRRWLSDGTLPRFLAGDRSGYRLFQCELCGAYWEDAIRHAHEISEEEARKVYPQAFG